MTSLRKIKVAKDALKKQLGAPSWLRGVGVIAGAGGMCLQVGVAEMNDEVSARIPATVEGVSVQVVEVGDVVAQRPPRKPDKRASKATGKVASASKSAKKPPKGRAVA